MINLYNLCIKKNLSLFPRNPERQPNYKLSKSCLTLSYVVLLVLFYGSSPVVVGSMVCEWLKYLQHHTSFSTGFGTNLPVDL